MARIRSIKPEFWTSAQVMECSPMARLLFIGMWNFADDAGRMTYSPKTLKAQIYPSDDSTTGDVTKLIVELSSNGLILIYSAENKEYIQITGWHHQKIDKPKPSKIPDPFIETSSIVRRQVATDLILSEGIGGDRKGSKHSPEPKTVQTTYSDEFETKFWKPYPRTPTMSKSEAWKAWQKLSDEQRSSSCKAIEPYKRFLKSKPTLETVHACRFLSQQRFEGFVGTTSDAQPSFDIRSSLV